MLARTLAAPVRSPSSRRPSASIALLPNLSPSRSSRPAASLRPFAALAPSSVPSHPAHERTLAAPAHIIPSHRTFSSTRTMAAQSATELLQGILDSNETYAAAFAQSDSALLKKLAVGQSPRIFWLGCSDSRVSAELSTGVAPGSIFVHRNIAQCFHKGDLSAAAALAYAVHVLKVDAIIVCGHTGCGGVKAGMQAAVDAAEKETAGEQLEAPAPGSVAETISKWIAPIKSLASTHLPSCEAAHRSPLDALSLAELTDQHVRDTVASVAESDIVRAAWDEGREISVHGWVYHVATAKLRDLDCGWKGVGVRAESLSRPSTYADSEPRED